MSKNYKQLDALIKKLKESPLFFLFLSSKELFHTNFWAWLFEIKGQEALRLFSDSQFEYMPKVGREIQKSYNPTKIKAYEIKSVVDLLITTSSSKIVVENKVKDFPTIEQLERIMGSFSLEPVESFVLVSLFRTSHLKQKIDVLENSEGKKWEIMTYGDLAKKIKPRIFTNGTLKPQFYESLIEDYIEFIQNLHNLAYDDSLKVTNEYDFAIEFNNGTDQLFKLLNDINFWEVYQKMRASHLKYEYENGYQPKFLDKVGYSINHQKATINFPYILINGNKKNVLEIGVQLENNQYRRYVSCKDAKKMFMRLSKERVFLDGTIKHKKNKEDFLNYGEDWKYQYELIHNTDEQINFHNLFTRINEDLEVLNYNEKKIINWFHQEYP